MAEARHSARLKQALGFSEVPTPTGCWHTNRFSSLLCLVWAVEERAEDQGPGHKLVRDAKSQSLTPDLLNQRL